MEKRKINWKEMRCLSFQKMPFKIILNSHEQKETNSPKVSLLDAGPSPEKTDGSGENHGRYIIFAYDFPEDSLNQKAVFGLIGQMTLYLIEMLNAGETDLSKAEFCILSEKKPETLMKQLEKSGIAMEGSGIYHVGFPFRFKIIVSEELPEKDASQVKSLIEHLEKNGNKSSLYKSNQQKESAAKADSFLICLPYFISAETGKKKKDL